MSGNSWTASDGEMPYDRHATDDGPRDPICAECGEAKHTPDCPYVRHVTAQWERDIAATKVKKASLRGAQARTGAA